MTCSLGFSLTFPSTFHLPPIPVNPSEIVCLKPTSHLISTQCSFLCVSKFCEWSQYRPYPQVLKFQCGVWLVWPSSHLTALLEIHWFLIPSHAHCPNPVPVKSNLGLGYCSSSLIGLPAVNQFQVWSVLYVAARLFSLFWLLFLNLVSFSRHSKASVFWPPPTVPASFQHYSHWGTPCSCWNIVLSS